jgi:hypothetical protein
MRKEKCGCCGIETETLYVMSQRDDGSWFEKTDGSLMELNDLLCCYDCCDALEREQVPAVYRDPICIA